MPQGGSENRRGNESGKAEAQTARPERLFEISEVFVLAVVAIATAWSGYQAAQWGGLQAVLYGRASTFGGQQLVADASIFTAWLQARDAGNARLQDVLVRRFTPDYRAAFDAWLKTDPFTNPDAPAGPGYMPGFRNPSLEQAKRLNAQASVTFTEGTAAREIANKYVRATVLFASVLLLVAVAQRFKVLRIRVGASAVAFVLLAYTLYTVSTLPRT